jgi:DNA-binding GntR family transcriptional regulator
MMVNGEKTKAPPTTTSHVTDAIRDGILTGHYPFGSRFDQKALADELGVSIVPIREGLRLLEAEGFVNIYPRRGAFVMEASIEGLQELYRIREVLEELATQLAVPKMTDEVIQQLESLLDQMEQATRSEDYPQLFELNYIFHLTIYQTANQPLLFDMLSVLWNRSSVYRRLYTYLPERAVQSLVEHQKIYAACKSGDVVAAGQAVRYNVQQTVKGILATWTEEDNNMTE